MVGMNGVLKITKKSIRKFQFGEGEPEIALDVIEIADQWHEINFALRVLENDVYVLPINKVNEFSANRLNFVQGLVAVAYAQLEKQPLTLSRIEAEQFIELVQQEARELRNFTSNKDKETLSVPENLDRGASSFQQ